MGKQTGKQERRYVRKDIRTHTIKCHDPWCNGTLDINYMGVMECWKLMPRVIIDTF